MVSQIKNWLFRNCNILRTKILRNESPCSKLQGIFIWKMFYIFQPVALGNQGWETGIAVYRGKRHHFRQRSWRDLAYGGHPRCKQRVILAEFVKELLRIYSRIFCSDLLFLTMSYLLRGGYREPPLQVL